MAVAQLPALLHSSVVSLPGDTPRRRSLAGGHVVGFLRPVELARSVVPERQEAGPSGGEMDQGAAALPGQVLPDIGVAEVRPGSIRLRSRVAGSSDGIFSFHTATPRRAVAGGRYRGLWHCHKSAPHGLRVH